MYQQARRRRSSVAWHRLRIGLKNFRYLVENFLPQRYENWSDDLKRMQDLLGDVHDLDVLRQQVRRNSAKLNPALVAEWIERIDRERKAQLQEFLARTTGPESPWLTWRGGISVGTRAGGQLDGRTATNRLASHFSPKSRSTFGVKIQRSSHAPCADMCSKQATPALLSSVKTRARRIDAQLRSRCGAWPKQTTSFARSGRVPSRSRRDCPRV